MAFPQRQNQRLALTRSVIKHMGDTAAGHQHGGMLLTGDPGIGKAQSLTSKVLTPSGWVLMGDLSVGDMVITPSGEAAPITGVYPQGSRDMYAITFHDGSRTEACPEHLWKCYYSPYSTSPAVEHICTTTDLMQLLAEMEVKGYNNNISIQLIVPADSPAVTLPINPYLLGVLLGDGGLTNSSVTLSTADAEILQEVVVNLPLGMCVTQSPNSTIDYRLVRDSTADHHEVHLMESLRQLNLVGKHSHEKFVPPAYKQGSVEQRWALLQGLMDTDGTVSSSGRSSFTSTSEQLAFDVQELVWSLGGCATIALRSPQYTYNGQQKLGRTAYCVQIAVPNPKQLFRLPRKVDRCRNQHGDGRIALRRRVESIDFVGHVPAQCIMVDHPDHLYITDDYIVTHNTTYIDALGQLLGMDVITLETPHIVEEHLINIPFIVYNHATGKTTAGSTEGRIGDNDYQLVLADSHLFQQMQHTNKVSDSEYQKYIASAPHSIQALYVALGGTADTIPPAIARVRSQFNNIMFLDEFYRETSQRIRNILRGILNGNIGMHRIPATTYIIYASNMADSGLDEIPHNNQFATKAFGPPKKDEWFVWLAGKYKQHHNIRLHDNILAKFQTLLNDADISYVDATTSVRTSPRRWEQILLYVNNSLPVSNQKDAVTLLTNVRNSFIHHETEEHSSLAEKVTTALSELILETSGISVSANASLEPHEWRDALEHAVSQLKAGGDSKRHIPVLSGPPGIGKTKFVSDVAHSQGLQLIDIDVSELFPDDVVGNPLPGGQYGAGGSTKIRVKFSLPKLYQVITNRIADADAAHEKFIRERHPEEADALIREYQNKRWKYLIFFDELNRCDSRTFNSLRRVMLEKNFGPAGDGSEVLRLPKAALVVGAWNPDPETGGTSTVTGHFADVVDVVPAKPGWTMTKNFLSNKKFNGISPDITEPAMRLLDEFVNKFHVRGDDTNGRHIGREQRAFYLDMNGKIVYFSPREYTDMYAAVIRSMDMCQEDFASDTDASNAERRQLLDDYLGDAVEETVSFPLIKHGLPPDSVVDSLKEWIHNLPDSIFGGFLSRTVHATKNLKSTLDAYIDGDHLQDMVKDPLIVNNQNTKNTNEIIDEMVDLLTSRLNSDESVHKYVLDAVHPAIARESDDLVFDDSQQVTLLRNFMFALLYTLEIHEYDSTRMAATAQSLSAAAANIKRSISSAGSAITEPVMKQASRALMSLRARMQTVVEGKS